MERKLVTIRRVKEIRPIEGADKIELCIISGWQCVVPKGQFKPDDLGVYHEIDCLLPIEKECYSFLANKGIKKMLVDGVEVSGHCLRTIRLRGALSQGLLLPISIFGLTEATEIRTLRESTEDLSESLGVIKYEAPIPAELSGVVKGSFPSFICKTDQERVQNLVEKLPEWFEKFNFEITEKLDGSSCTIYLNDGEFGICSRNLDLKETEGNSFWRFAREQEIEAKMREVGRNIAIQGELIGHGIQKNPYKLSKQEFRIFDIFDIDAQKYLLEQERYSLISDLELSLTSHHVPVLSRNVHKSQSIDDLLSLANQKSQLSDSPAEGIVFKATTYSDDPEARGGVVSFKVINNEYLLKERD